MSDKTDGGKKLVKGITSLENRLWSIGMFYTMGRYWIAEGTQAIMDTLSFWDWIWAMLKMYILWPLYLGALPDISFFFDWL